MNRDCLNGDFYGMLESSATEKAQLLVIILTIQDKNMIDIHNFYSQCTAQPVSELKNEGAIPVLYSRKCAEGEHCSACKWDSESELRKKWPELPPCFNAVMDEDAQWEEMRRESDAIPAAQEEGQESKEDEQKEEEHDQGQGEEEEEEEEDDDDDGDDEEEEKEEEEEDGDVVEEREEREGREEGEEGEDERTYGCEYDCGFAGTFDEVSTHKLLCSKCPAPDNLHTGVSSLTSTEVNITCANFERNGVVVLPR